MSTLGRVPILLALAGAPYEEPLLVALEHVPGRLQVVRRCVDLTDLLAAAAAGTATVAVVGSRLGRLDADAVARLSRAGLFVVGVTDGADVVASQQLRAIGIGTVLAADAMAGGASLAAALAAVLDGIAPDVGAPVDRSDTAAARRALVDGPVDGQPEPAGGRLGRLLAVWGPIGAPGRSTIATCMAHELAGLQVETLLADADTYGPSLAQVLGIRDEASGLAAAVREANAGTLDVVALARCARALRPGLRVLTGVTRPDRWPELPSPALASVWRTARLLAGWTVVDCGFCLEQDEDLVYDTAAPLRNGATLASLGAADVVLAVGSADPVGFQRLVRALPELRSAAGSAQVRVVINQVRRGPVGRNPERRLAESLERYAGVTGAVFVPQDDQAADRAVAVGHALVEVAPGSPARAVLAGLASSLVSG